LNIAVFRKSTEMKFKRIRINDPTLYPTEKIAIGRAQSYKQALRKMGIRNALEIQTRYICPINGIGIVNTPCKEKKLKLTPKQAPEQIDNQ